MDLPVQLNQEIELDINSINHGGKGVGRYQGLAVFVPYTLPGEKVLAKVTGMKKNYALAEVQAILEPASNRTQAPCVAFQSCGGCQLQHQDYQEHLAMKRQLVKDNLTRVAKLENVIVHPTLGMASPWGYRNKVHFQVKEQNGGLTLGFYAEGSHSLVAVDRCLLVDHELITVAQKVESLANKYQITPYDWQAQKGQLRHILLRKGLVTGEIMVVLVTSGEKIPNDLLLAKELMNNNEKIVSVIRNINNSTGRIVLGEESLVLGGRKHIWERLGDLTFAVSATSFFQVNPRQAEVLYQKALDYAGLSGQEQVIDLYCGVGSLSLFLAKKAKKVIGVEVVAEAILDAKRNAELNKICNAQFLAGKTEEILPKMGQKGIKAEVLVLDPPRKGCEKGALDAIAQLGPEKIIYVSCDPGTLARDLRILADQGYQTLEVQPVDMFPWTNHVEAVILLQRLKP